MRIYNSADRLRFIVSFAYTDLSIARDGDLMNFREELARFLRPPVAGGDRAGGIFATAMPRPGCEDLTVDQLGIIQKAARRILEPFAAGQQDQTPAKRTKIAANAPEVHVKLVIMPTADGGLPVMSIWGSIWDTFEATLALLLMTEPSDRLLICADEECERVFYRIRKQKFCRHACATRTSARNHRGTDKGKAANRANAGRQYRRRGYKVDDPAADAFADFGNTVTDRGQ